MMPPPSRSMPAWDSSGAGSPCRYGAVAAAWSRRARVSSFGLSGLPVAQAGHWSWQRPHSVHVEKSSRPFQVKSSIAPTPRRASSGRSSRAARSIVAPAGVRSGCSGPSATVPSGVASRVDVHHREEPVPRDAHGRLQPDHHEPRHRHDDLDGRDDDHGGLERRRRDPLPRRAQPRGEGVVPGAAAAERVLERADHDHGEHHDQHGALDVERADLVGPEEARPSRVLAAGQQPQAQHDQRHDAEQRSPRERLDRPLERGEGADSGSVNVGSTTCP